MTNAQKMSVVKVLLDNDEQATDALVVAYLDEARAAILSVLYPFTDSYDCLTLPSKYDHLQCQLAVRYFLRRGAQGELIHNENGINRTYGSVDDADLLEKIVPYVKI